MSRCSFARWNPAGATPGGRIDPRVLIYHVTAIHGDARPHSGLEWHFEVSLTGQLEQVVDTNLRADANRNANGFAISVETEGKGEGIWTDAQLEMNEKLGDWCIDTHPKIKRQRCDRWDGSGIGYHVMFGAPGPWTPVAKSCPGPKRIHQFNTILLPSLISGAPIQELDMPFKDQPGENYHIAAAHNGLLLDLPFSGKHGDPVMVFPSDGVVDQRWRLIHNGDGTVSLRSRDGSLALDVGTGDNSTKNGQGLIVWTPHVGGQQRFILKPTDQPTEFNIVHQASGRCLDVWAWGGPNARVVLWDLNNTTNQRFRFIPTI